MNLRNKKGFTLLEIIIVVIIIGIVASLALPRLFRSTEFARAQEALTFLGTLRSSMERCYVINNSYAACNSWAALDVEDPSVTNPAANHFTYTWNPVPTVNTWTILATRNANDGGTATDTVAMNQNGQKTGTGSYINIR